MKRYIILSPTMQRSVYYFRYTRDNLERYIAYTDKVNLVITLRDGRHLQFVTEEQYDRKIRYGSRSRPIFDLYFERELDEFIKGGKLC